ncbi:hypothetical protein D3C81_1931150 [compost metagenome]
MNYGKVVNNDVTNSDYHQDTQSLTNGEKSINHSDDTGDLEYQLPLYLTDINN